MKTLLKGRTFKWLYEKRELNLERLPFGLRKNIKESTYKDSTYVVFSGTPKENNAFKDACVLV